VVRDIDPCDLASQVNQAEKEAVPLERNVCLHRGEPGGRLSDTTYYLVLVRVEAAGTSAEFDIGAFFVRGQCA
jgi:hypothetical protein